MPARELFHKVLTPCIKIWEVRKNSYFKETGNIRLLFTYQSPFYVANSFLWTKQKNNSWMWSCYSELSNKQAANLTHFENFFLPTCLIRTYTFIYFCGKLPPTRLLEPARLFIFRKKSWLHSYFYRFVWNFLF